MKKQKILALLMAVVFMVASMPAVVVFADSISKEAQACKDIGVLIGEDATGVTSKYLAKTPTRLQAYIISLRLKGLYFEAGDYENDYNFTDASSAGWAENFLAYARNNPELGWGGYPDGSFGVNDKISGQAFYKVMLETLGYRQGNDFEYADTLKFAEKIGLVDDADAIAGIKSFTVDDIATGIYNALNTKPENEDEKKLIDILVEKGVITSEKAVAAGFTLSAEAVDVVSFEALSNTKLKVVFGKEIALQKADIEITTLDGDDRLSVLSVESNGKESVITTTEAEPFNAYEITINTLAPTGGMAVRGYKHKYVAMPEDTTKPTVKHELLGRNEIMLTFNEEMDRASAEDLDNYMIEYDVTILSADLSDSGNYVILKTTDISARDFYRLTVQNVCDVAGNSIVRYRAAFDGAGDDTKEPEVASVRSENDTTVKVIFNERVSENSAEDTGNYSADDLDIEEAKLDETGKIVTLTTSKQDSDTGYKLTVSSVQDSWGNAVYKKTFGFVPDSSDASAVVLAISNVEVQVTFTKEMDEASAEDIDNYSINNDLEIKEAILDETGKNVTLITSKQTERKLYTLTISNVYDEWGNKLNTAKETFGGMAGDTKDLSYTVKSNGNEVIVTFSKRVDIKTAEDVFNYDLDDDLGYAARAELDNTGRVITLLTKEQDNGEIYTITISGIKDIYGNEISSTESVCTKKFAGISEENESGDGSLALETVVPVNVNTIDLVFNDELTDEELDDLDVELTVPDGYDYDLPSSLDFYKYFVDGEKNVRLQFKTSSSKNPEVFEWGNIYQVEVKEVDRLKTEDDANIKLFAGTNTANDTPKIEEVEAINSTAVVVTFSEPVKGISKSQFDIKTGITISGVSVADEDEITDKVIVYTTSSTKFKDADYKLYVRSGVKDAAGLNSVDMESDEYIEFEGTSEANESPYIDSDITVLDSYTLQFVMSEEIKDITTSSFTVKKASGSSTRTQSVSKAVLDDDRKTVTLYLSTQYEALDSDYSYVIVANGVKDLQDMSIDSADKEVEFDGEDIELEKLEIISATINADNDMITLTTNRKLNISNLSISDFELSGAGYDKSTSDKVAYDENKITIKLDNDLDSNKELKIGITSTGRSRIRDYNYQSISTQQVEVETN
ncbi:MAG TPA: hypothetical protein VN549_00065 [Negativicutes bacterium]|nr:hypothetical protein [Negativicutes bacterium]